MSNWQALILGLVQGFTEFLPISSSGHLVLFQQLFSLDEPLLAFNILVHVATLLAIIIFFGKSLLKVTFRELLLLGIASVPAVIVGVVFKDQIEALFENDIFLGLELIVTGLINFYIDWKIQRSKDVPVTEVVAIDTRIVEQLNPVKSLFIGAAQAFAIIPAISRSGSTVAGALAVGMDRESAFRFSFLLAIPALAGAGVLGAKDVLDAGSLPLEPLTYVIGGLAALVAGLISLKFFKYVITKARLLYFGWYCVILGVIITLLPIL
ncbi:MAG: undecaprenyl-diphosphate phosphatase [bacterium]|nr:undecaprenyl-diphosphate phosphatase [bacterium]